MSDYIKAEISGTVGRTGEAKNGPYAVIEITKPGSEYPDRVTVWGLSSTTGSPITVTGNLSWKKSERDGKTYVDVSLNNHEIIRQTDQTPTAYNDSDVPF